MKAFALYRYELVSVALSQRYLPPLLVFLAALAVGTGSSSGPLLQSYAFCVAAITICGTWLTAAVVNHEDPVQRQLVIVAAGTARRVLGSSIAVTFTGFLVMIALGLCYPVLSGHHTVTAGAVAVGATAQLAGASVGAALGLLTSRLVIPHVGVAVVTAVIALLVVLLSPWATPVLPLIRLLNDRESPASTVGALIGLTGLSLAILILSAVATHLVASRRA